MHKEGIMRDSKVPFPHLYCWFGKKKDGTWLFCVEFWKLNAITIRDILPTPTIDELFDQLNGTRYFSKFDFLLGYDQNRVHPEDVPKTAFCTHDGHYKFLVMPFSLTNTPSTAQATMNEIFIHYLSRYVLVF